MPKIQMLNSTQYILNPPDTMSEVDEESGVITTMPNIYINEFTQEEIDSVVVYKTHIFDVTNRVIVKLNNYGDIL